MTLIVDAGPLVALADAEDPQREAILGALEADPGSLIVPAPTTAEVDCLLGERFGRAARRAFLADLAGGRFAAPAWNAATTRRSPNSTTAIAISSSCLPTAHWS